MMKRTTKTLPARLLVVLAVITALSVGRNGEPLATPVGAEKQLPEQLFQINRQKGWLIPGEDQFTVPLKTGAEQAAGQPIEVKHFKCSGELPLSDVEFYYRRGDGQLQINTMLMAVHDFASASLNGRTFAYRVAMVTVDVSSDGSRKYGGGMIILYYYDEDGDGKFETRYGDLTNFKLPERFKNK